MTTGRRFGITLTDAGDTIDTGHIMPTITTVRTIYHTTDGRPLRRGTRIRLLVDEHARDYDTPRGSEGTINYETDGEGRITVHFDNGHYLSAIPSWVAIIEEQEAETGGGEMPRRGRDANGVELSPGQTVRVINDVLERFGAPRGSTGELVGIDGNSAEVMFPSASRTLLLRSDELELDVPGLATDEGATFTRLLQSNDDMMIIGTQLFHLKAEEIPEGSEILRQYQDQMVQQFQQAREGLRRAEQQLQRRTESRCEMPQVSLADVERGMRLWRDQHGTLYIVPFRYAPKTIEFNHRVRELTNEHKERLACDCLLQVQTYQRHEVSLILLETDNLAQMHHYHAMGGGDCTGDLQKPTGYLEPRQVWELRDAYQSTLTVVNRNSPAQSEPRGMPNTDRLWEDATEVEGRWTTRDRLPDVPPEGYQVGDLVQVIRAYEGFREGNRGSIGRVVTGGTHAIGVEFLFHFREGHDCDMQCENGHGYNFDQQSLRPAQMGARRTRESGAYWRMTDGERTNLQPTGWATTN